MDAITILEHDHREMEALFKRYKRLSAGARAEKKKVVDALIVELARHAAVEEQLLYPAVRERVRRLDKLALQCLEEHHVVKWLLYELDRLEPRHERYDAKVAVLDETVTQHIDEEEGELFPALRKAFTKEELGDLGVLMEEAKKIAPTRPHPRAPDQPPANIFAGTLAGLLDRGRDFLSGELRAPRELAARISRRKPKKKAAAKRR